MREAADRFVHLKVFSEYSLYESTVALHRYIEGAKARGLKHLAVSDHGHMFAVAEFFRLCRQAGINPIIGARFSLSASSLFDLSEGKAGRSEEPAKRVQKEKDATGAPEIHLIAENNRGYRNLMQLSSHYCLYTEGPVLTDSFLEKYHDGLIALSGGEEGEVTQLVAEGREEEAERRVSQLQRIFGKDNFFLEVEADGENAQEVHEPDVRESREDFSTIDGVNEIDGTKRVHIRDRLRRISERCDSPLVATCSVCYLHKSEAEAWHVLRKIGSSSVREGDKDEGCCLETMRPAGAPSEESTDLHYFKTREEVIRLFSDMPKALENTLRIAERCRVEIPVNAPDLPEFDLPPDYTSSSDYLRACAVEGLSRRYSPVPEKTYWILEKELGAIEASGYVDYYLIVADYVYYARERDIPVGPGRGASACSLVAYALGITDIDPLKYGLISERFLNIERFRGKERMAGHTRSAAPDFDIDFCFLRRGEVMDYVRRKYGKEHAAGIVTFKRYGPRMAIRDVARLQGLPYSETESLIRKLPAKSGDISSAVEESSELKEAVAGNTPVGRVLEIARVLEGLPVQVSSHAAGIALSGLPMSACSPLYKDEKSGCVCSQYTAERLEEMGPVKFDFLGFKVLSLLHTCETRIRERWGQVGRPGSNPEFELSRIPEGDEETLRILGEGKTTGVFQCESSGMKELLRKAKPRSIEEIAALNAIYRPGALDMIPAYIEAKREGYKEHEKGSSFHRLPELERVLAGTCGLIIYQEQIMEIAHTAAGWSYGKADILRRTLVGKDDERTREWKSGFLEDAGKNGYSHEDAEAIFEALRGAAPCSALKAHTISYALLAYRSAFLKAHYPEEYMRSVLEMHRDNPDRYAWYLNEARRMKLSLDNE